MDLTDYSNYQGAFSNALHNTNPGHNSPLSPPKGWEGSESDYLDMLNERMMSTGFDQRFYSIVKVLTNRHHKVNITGCYADAAHLFIKKQCLISIGMRTTKSEPTHNTTQTSAQDRYLDLPIVDKLVKADLLQNYSRIMDTTNR